MNSKAYPVLLITGTIQVNNDMPFVVVKNADERLEAYINTIKWAIDVTSFKFIVFCENTGYELEQVHIAANAHSKYKKFEYLTFRGNSKRIIEQGKGYGEGEIISYALQNSKLLDGAEYFCKITGRITIENVSQCMRNRRNYFMHVEGERKIDTRFYCIKTRDYKTYLLRAYKKVDDSNGVYLEHVFYDSVRNLRYRSFYDIPRIIGISGSTGISYERKRSSRARSVISLMCRMNIYNSYIIWNTIHKISGFRMKKKENGYKIE